MSGNGVAARFLSFRGAGLETGKKGKVGISRYHFPIFGLVTRSLQEGWVLGMYHRIF